MDISCNPLCYKTVSPDSSHCVGLALIHHLDSQHWERTGDSHSSRKLPQVPCATGTSTSWETSSETIENSWFHRWGKIAYLNNWIVYNWIEIENRWFHVSSGMIKRRQNPRTRRYLFQGPSISRRLSPQQIKIHTSHSTICTTHSTPPHTLHSNLHTRLYASTTHSVHCILYTPYILHTLYLILYTPHFTTHTLHYTLRTPESILHTLHSKLQVLHIQLYTSHSLHSALHT